MLLVWRAAGGGVRPKSGNGRRLEISAGRVIWADTHRWEREAHRVASAGRQRKGCSRDQAALWRREGSVPGPHHRPSASRGRCRCPHLVTVTATVRLRLRPRPANANPSAPAVAFELCPGTSSLVAQGSATATGLGLDASGLDSGHPWPWSRARDSEPPSGRRGRPMAAVAAAIASGGGGGDVSAAVLQPPSPTASLPSSQTSTDLLPVLLAGRLKAAKVQTERPHS